MKLKKAAASVLIALAALAATVAPAAAWEQIGARDVRDATERDTIIVEGPRRYERIRLCAYRNPINLYDLDVRFRNGGRQDVEVRQRLAPGQCTRAINLVGDDRNIASVAMVYEETSFRRRHATVRLFAE